MTGIHDNARGRSSGRPARRGIRRLLVTAVAAGAVALTAVAALPAGAQTVPPIEVPPLPSIPLPDTPLTPPVQTILDGTGVTGSGGIEVSGVPALPGVPGVPSVPNLAFPGVPTPPLPAVPGVPDPAMVGLLLPLVAADPVGGTCIVVNATVPPAAPVCAAVQNLVDSVTGAAAPGSAAAAEVATQAGGSGSLPFTGANPLVLGAAAAGLLALGALALRLRARVRRPALLGA